MATMVPRRDWRQAGIGRAVRRCRGNLGLPLWAILWCALLLAQGGCGGSRDEQRHPRYQRAIRLNTEGKYAAAAAEWEEYLRRYPPATTGAHLELAQIYHDHLDDPALAAHHYRRHLEIFPDTTDREVIEAFLAAVEKRQYERLTERFSPDMAWREEAQRLREHEQRALRAIERLMAENRYLQQQSGVRLEAAPVPPSVSPAIPPSTTAASPPSPIPPPPGPAEVMRIHVVRDGDSLAKISREVYGSASHYMRIYEANRDRLASPGQLSVGQELRIPRLESGPAP